MATSKGVHLIVFEDGVAHFVRVVDDASHGSSPMCGKELTKPRSKPVAEAEFVCNSCVPIMCDETGIDKEEFAELLKENG